MTDTVNVPTFRLAEATRPTRTTRASRPTTTHAPVAADGESAPTWMRALGAVLLLGGGALTAAVLGWPGDAPEVALLVPGVVALVGGALLLLARTRIAVTDTDVVLRFRPLPARRIDRRRIAEVAVVEALTYPARSGPTIAVVRPGSRAPRALGGAEVLEVPGTAELLDGTSIDARIPGAAVARIVDRLDAWAPAVATPTTAPALDEVLDVDDRVAERILRIGPHGLFAVETVSSAQDEDAPVVVLHNGGAEHRTGATDYQVDLARALARDGVRVVRVDRRGTGESSPVHADEQAFLFAQEWLDDQRAVVAALRVPAERLAIVGMCAGAWLAGRAVEEHPRLVVEISPNDYRRTPAAPGSYAETAQGVADASPLRRWLRGPYNRWVPAGLRDRIARRGALGSVVGHLGPVLDRGTDVVVVATPEDVALFDRFGGRRAVRRWGARLTVVEVPDGDHALFSPGMRRTVVAEVRSRVAETFPARALSR